MELFLLGILLFNFGNFNFYTFLFHVIIRFRST
jgi:hypothetical protein